MKRLATVLILLTIVCMTPTGAAMKKFEASYALVVGINNYPNARWPNLSYAVKDAEGMASFLVQQGFEVIKLINEQATRAEIIYFLEDILAPKIRTDDRILLFFAGHGATRNLRGKEYGYIVPHDGKKGFSSYIAMDQLRTLALKMDNAKHILFIMDACYGGLMTGMRGSTISENHPYYLDEIRSRKARQVITAGGADQQVADKGRGQHSVFTGYLLDALAKAQADMNGDGYVTFSELNTYILPAASTSIQTPAWSTMAGHEAGEFLFQISIAGKRTKPKISPPETGQKRSAPSYEKEVSNIVKDYFSANNQTDTDRLLALMAPSVDYYRAGLYGHAQIKEDKLKFYARWPQVAYTPVGELAIDRRGANEISVGIHYDFSVRNTALCKGRHGAASKSLRLAKFGSRWLIVSIKENVDTRDKFNPCLN
jgi:hypothetical protein